MSYKHILFAILFLSVIFICYSCKEKTEIVGVETVFSIQEINIPPVLNSSSGKPKLFTTKVTHPSNNAGIEVVVFVLIDLTGTEVLREEMFDDGDNNSGSGDVIAFDQVYSMTVIPNQLGIPDGDYELNIVAKAVSGDSLMSPNQELSIFPNQPPQILDVFFPDSILPGMQPFEAYITVYDSNGLDDVKWVMIQGYDSINTFPIFQDVVFNPMDNSADFPFVIDSSYSAKKIGNYELKFFAVDQVEDTSNVFSLFTHFENTPPLIWDAVVPDTLRLPTSGDVSVKITVRVKDRQSLADIDSVYFNSEKPDGEPSSGNPFLLFDNGLPYNLGNPIAVGDEISGDGIYTLTIFLQAGTPIGTYKFSFFARDKVNQLTAGPIKLLEVIN
jgi:hypothetical protein